jgi:hypothetical protein
MRVRDSRLSVSRSCRAFNGICESKSYSFEETHEYILLFIDTPFLLAAIQYRIQSSTY